MLQPVQRELTAVRVQSSDNMKVVSEQLCRTSCVSKQRREPTVKTAGIRYFDCPIPVMPYKSGTAK